MSSVTVETTDGEAHAASSALAVPPAAPPKPAASPETQADDLDVERIREDFPILARRVHDHELVFLDSAASSQKPVQVLDAMERVYRSSYANVHRSAYTLSEESTLLYEQARARIARFIGARSSRQIVFTRNATEALNLVAYSYGRHFLRAGDEIVLTELEHHANFVPWLVLAKEIGVILKFIPLLPNGTLDLAAFDALLTPRVKLVSFAHVSNVLGTITDPAPIVERAHSIGARVILDACQSVPHMPVDVEAIGCDFLAFSGHKMLGPTGIGVLYAGRDLLEEMPPFLTGGEMISEVTFEGAKWTGAPHKFEAGTPAFVEAVGLGAAVDYLRKLGMDRVRSHERALTAYALDRLGEMPGLHIVGPTDPEIRAGVISFTVDGVPLDDLAALLDLQGIAIRAGQHCASPLHLRLGLSGTARASFYIYNRPEDVDALVAGILDAKRHIGE